MLLTKPYVIIKTQFEGFHYWGEAPQLVAFLRNRHRHMFHVEVRVSVTELDRDIEVILFKRHIDELLNDMKPRIDSEGWSCEMIANELASLLLDEYDSNEIEIVVLEDNENGGGVYVRK